MRLGLVTDIHNQAAFLRRALSLFHAAGVDQVVTIGDTCDAFSNGDGADEVAGLLDRCNAVGVWGNHDFTLCRDTPERIRARCSPFLLSVMARMQPRLTIEDCHFSHKEASVDPFDVSQLWDVGENRPNMTLRAHRSFAAACSRWHFIGHYHRWFAATPTGPLDWSGATALQFEANQRYFVVVGAVFDGWCGILDTTQRTLTPMRCDDV